MRESLEKRGIQDQAFFFLLLVTTGLHWGGFWNIYYNVKVFKRFKRLYIEKLSEYIERGLGLNENYNSGYAMDMYYAFIYISYILHVLCVFVCMNGFYIMSWLSQNKRFPIHGANMAENGYFPLLGDSHHSVKKEKERAYLFWVIVCILNFVAVPLNFHLCWHLGILSLLFLK